MSLCQHHMENYSIMQTQEEMRKDKGTNRDQHVYLSCEE